MTAIGLLQSSCPTRELRTFCCRSSAEDRLQKRAQLTDSYGETPELHCDADSLIEDIVRPQNDDSIK